MAVGLEEEVVLLEEACDLATSQKSELTVELASVVKAEDALGLVREELLRPDHKPVLCVTLKAAMRLGSDWIGFVLALSFFLHFFRNFLGFW